MELQQIKPGREGNFADAVLEGARHKAAVIIQQAQQAREKALQQAYAQCEKADYGHIKAEHQRDTQRSGAAARQDARKQLLRYRGQLLGQVFEDAKAQLQTFTQSGQYAPWLQQKLQKLAASLAAGQQGVLYLRPADMQYVPLLQQQLQGFTAQPDEEITLGGFVLQAGHLLYNETLDAALEEQKQKFTQTSGLYLQADEV